MKNSTTTVEAFYSAQEISLDNFKKEQQKALTEFESKLYKDLKDFKATVHKEVLIDSIKTLTENNIERLSVQNLKDVLDIIDSYINNSLTLEWSTTSKLTTAKSSKHHYCIVEKENLRFQVLIDNYVAIENGYFISLYNAKDWCETHCKSS